MTGIRLCVSDTRADQETRNGRHVPAGSSAVIYWLVQHRDCDPGPRSEIVSDREGKISHQPLESPGESPRLRKRPILYGEVATGEECSYGAVTILGNTRHPLQYRSQRKRSYLGPLVVP
jgi:hypothetical protein